MASLITFFAGVSCFCVWMFAKNYGLLIFFALINVSTQSRVAYGFMPCLYNISRAF